MDLSAVLSRVRRGIREDLGLHLLAVSGLTIAFFCLIAALLAITNFDRMAERWASGARLTVYLAENAAELEVEKLAAALRALPEVREVSAVSPEASRQDFLSNSGSDEMLAQLPLDAFAPSLEVKLTPSLDAAGASALAGRIERFSSVDDVETYEGWRLRIERLVTAGEAVTIALFVFVLVCVVLLVGGTIRLAVSGRRDEIEILKLCGATDAFVRSPFVVEGAAQGFVAALIATLGSVILFVVLRTDIDTALMALGGVRSAFVHPGWVAALLFGGAFMGAAGSRWSLGRYLHV